MILLLTVNLLTSFYKEKSCFAQSAGAIEYTDSTSAEG